MFCVTTGTEFNAALAQAAAIEDEPAAEIRLASGVYSGSFLYVSQRAWEPSIHVSGGWAAGCASRTSAPSEITGDLIFTGSERLNYPASAENLRIGGMMATRSNGAFTLMDSTVAGDLTAPCCPGAVVLERNIVLGTTVNIVSSADVSASVVRNNVFAGNLNSFVWYDTTRGSGSLVFRGNTVHFSSGWPRFQLSILSGDLVATEFRRNLITSTGNGTVLIDLDFNDNFLVGPSWMGDNWIGFNTSNVTLRPSNILDGNGNIVGPFGLPYLSAIPPYDFHLMPGSPQIDYSLPTAEDAGDRDLDGRPRVMGGLVDVGAYEALADPVFSSGFE